MVIIRFAHFCSINLSKCNHILFNLRRARQQMTEEAEKRIYQNIEQHKSDTEDGMYTLPKVGKHTGSKGSRASYVCVDDVPVKDEADGGYVDVSDVEMIRPNSNQSEVSAYSVSMPFSSETDVSNTTHENCSNSGYEITEPVQSNDKLIITRGSVFYDNNTTNNISDTLHSTNKTECDAMYDHLNDGNDIETSTNYDSVQLRQRITFNENNYDHLSDDQQADHSTFSRNVDSAYDHAPYTTERDYGAFLGQPDLSENEYDYTCV